MLKGSNQKGGLLGYWLIEGATSLSQTCTTNALPRRHSSAMHKLKGHSSCTVQRSDLIPLPSFLAAAAAVLQPGHPLDLMGLQGHPQMAGSSDEDESEEGESGGRGRVLVLG
jgi:hypothetical protein